MASGSAYLTFPSNVNSVEFPNNTNSKYTVRLTKPLVYGSGEWECALTSIHYSNNWKNVTQGVLTIHKKQLNGVDQQISIPLGSGRFTNIQGLIDQIHKYLSEVRLREVLDIKYEALTNQTRIYVRKRGYKIQFSQDLAEILGFQANKPYKMGMYVSELPPDINRGFTSIYVYTNIIRDQLVGDVSVPLLRVVPVQGEAFTNQSIEFKNPQYLEMVNISSDLVEVVLTRDDGTLVPFDGGKVTLVVHIRPKAAF